MKRLAISTIAICSLLVLASCGAPQSQPSPPPTEPVTPGYIQSYDHKLGYGFEYPEDWKVHSPEEVTPGGGIEKVEMFTKKGEGIIN